jgi:hypothetical protein
MQRPAGTRTSCAVERCVADDPNGELHAVSAAQPRRATHGFCWSTERGTCGERRQYPAEEKKETAAVENWWQRRWKRHTEISHEKQN